MKTYTFHVNGMHCNACVVLTESELSEVPGISRVRSSLASRSLEVTGEFGEKSPEDIARDLSAVLKPHGYTLSVTEQKSRVQWAEFKIALPIAAAFIALFIVLQKIGIINVITADEVGYGTAFLIGLIASVSTCMAVVGGLVLSISANFAKEGERVRPQMLFHIGRLVSFAILGGAMGALGSTFQLGVSGSLVLNFVIASVLIILGLNLLDVFPWAMRLQPVLPSFIGRRVQNLKNINHTLTPLLVGFATFFMPCGFTQTMQIYALSTGNFWSGSLIMFAFAMGTLPVLALLSFSSLGIQKMARSGMFFKTAGLVVIFFGVFGLVNSFVVIGVLPPIFNF